MHRTGDQAVDLALLEHHGADRDRVGEVLAGDVLGPALVPPQLGQRGDVALGDIPRVHGGDAAGQPQPEAPGLRGHLIGRAQQQAAGDAAFGARHGGLHGARFGALRHDDERVGGTGPLDQLVAERGGAGPPGPGRPGQRLQPGRVERVGDGVRHALDPFGVVDGQTRVEIAHFGGGVVAVELDQQDGQAHGRRGLGELGDPRIGRGPGAQQQGGQVGPAQLGQVGGHDHLVPVAGDHDQPAGVQDPDTARDALREYRYVLDAPGQVTFVQHLRMQLADQVADPQPGQLRPVRDAGEEAELAPGQGGSQPGGRGGIGLGHAVDHAADDPGLLAGDVSARRDGELLGQAVRVAVARARGRPASRRHPAPGPGPGSASWRTASTAPS